MVYLLHLLWIAHLICAAITFVYFALSYIPKDLALIWNKELGYSTFLRLFGTLACPIVWVIRAFFWEILLPYLKLPEFREAVDDYFFWY